MRRVLSGTLQDEDLAGWDKPDMKTAFKQAKKSLKKKKKKKNDRSVAKVIIEVDVKVK